MEKIFNTLIDSFIDHKVGITEDFLSNALALHLIDNLNSLFQKDLLSSAGTGNNTLVVHNQLVRNDKIYWLDRKHNNIHENSFFDLMDNFVRFLNSTCYTGITGYEFHYALYEREAFTKSILISFKTMAAGNIL